MADDLITIDIKVDTSSLIDAKKKLSEFQSQMGKNNSVLGLSRALGSVESNIQELLRAQDRGRLSQRSFQQGLLEQRKALEAMGMSSYVARRRVEEFARALRDQQSAEAARTLANAHEQTRLRYVAGAAAAARLRQAQNELSAAYRAGVISIEEYRQALILLNQQNAGNQAGTNNLGVGMQQLGYQVGDFFVQVQSGQNVMVAFGQQATQLVGALYLLPPAVLASRVAIAGLSVSVSFLIMSLGIIVPIATAVGAAFLRYREEANKANDTTEETINVFDRLKDATEDLHDEMMKIIDPNYDTNLKGTSDELSRLTSEYEKAKRAVEALSGAQGGSVGMGAGAATRFLNANVAAAEAALREAEAKLEAYKTQVELTKEARKTADALEDVADMELPFTAKVRILADMLGIAADEAKRLLNNLPVGMDYGDSTALFGMSGADLVYTPEQKETRQRAGGAGNVIDITQIIEARKQQIEQERILLSLSGQAQEAERIYFELLKQNTDATVKLSDTELRAAANLEASYLTRNKLIEEQIALQQQIAGTIQSSMETAFMSMVDGTATVKDAFRSMARDIIAELYRVLVVQQMVGAFKTGGGGILGAIAPIFGRASGGTVMSNTPYLVGENGPEIVVPRNRGHVMNADLTAKAMGNSGAINVVNNINVTGGSDPAAIRMEVAKLMPQITNATKSAVIDARRRGGQMKAAFQ
jgi:hypothetical protein